MARGVNKVILVGNLGGDPEVRYTPSGSAVANVALATSDVWRDKQMGELQEKTEWHRVVFFNRLAEIVGQYLRKGSKIYVEGALRTKKWVDKSGVERYTTEIIANEMHMLDSRPPAGGGIGGHAGHQHIGVGGTERFNSTATASTHVASEPVSGFAAQPHDSSSTSASSSHFVGTMSEPTVHDDDIPF